MTRAVGCYGGYGRYGCSPGVQGVRVLFYFIEASCDLTNIQEEGVGDASKKNASGKDSAIRGIRECSIGNLESGVVISIGQKPNVVGTTTYNKSRREPHPSS